jgi:hypothetical protein
MRNLWPTHQSNQGGFVLILSLIQSLVILTIMTGVMTLALYNLGAAKRSTYITNATYAAEAGADRVMYEINQDTAYTGTNTVCPIGTAGSNPVTLYNNATGRATYETCVTTGSITNEKIVYAVGKVYVPASSTAPKSTKTVRLVIEGTPAGSYTIQTGPGGLIMSNSATITTGPIFIGGYLTMSNTARIGSAASPVAVSVANMRCPTPVNSSWPQVCSMGTQNNPITINNSAHIYGDTKANGQTNTSGLTNPGLTASTGVTEVTLPDHDRTGQKAAVASTLTSSNASCSGSQNKTWAANVKVTGNVTLSNSCTITISGNAWITGNMNLSNTSQFKVAASVTSTPTVMIDGSSGITLSNQSVVAANAAGIGVNFITFYSGNGCSPDCTTVTGTDLNNSMNITTVSIGNQGLAASSTFYARWTALTLSNGGNIGAILAQKITLSNSGNITFGGGSGGASGWSWDVRYYETL